MKKLLLPLVLLLCLVSAIATGQADTTTSSTKAPSPKTEKAKPSAAVWIALGTVFFAIFVALNAKKMKKHRE